MTIAGRVGRYTRCQLSLFGVLAALPLCATCASHVGVAGSAAPASELGPPDQPLLWTQAQKQAGFANMDQVYPVRAVSRASRVPVAPYPLPVALRDLSQVKVSGRGSISDFCERYKVAGMLVIKHGKIVHEHYAYGNSAKTRWTSWSVAKSVVSLLVGAAIADGYIGSVDELASQYLPALKDGAYANVTLRQLLEMKSGVEWNEDYADPTSDVNTMRPEVRRGSLAFQRFMSSKPRVAEPGVFWHYNTGDTYLLADLLRAAIGNNLSAYLSRTIWSRFAMEDDAYWMLDREHGDEEGGYGLSATLRDFGRLGMFALRGGRLPDGTCALPEKYMEQSTERPASYPSYGYLWWIYAHSYSACGVFGQQIRVYPQDELVIVTHGFSKLALESFDDANHLFDAINDALKGS